MGPRLARIRQLTRAHLREHHLQASTLRLTYAREAAAELAAIVALERECCGFLSFQLTEGDAAVDLLIAAPTPGGVDAQWLFAQFLPDPLPFGASPACGCGKG